MLYFSFCFVLFTIHFVNTFYFTITIKTSCFINCCLCHIQIVKYIKKRAQLTLEYTKALSKLQQKTVDSLYFEESTTRGFFEQVRSTDEEIIGVYNYQSQMILDQVVAPLEQLHAELDASRRKLFQQGMSLDKELKDSRAALLRTREKYYKTSHDLENAGYAVKDLEGNPKKRGELEKLDKKITRLRQDVAIDKANYEEQITATNQCQHEFYTTTMPNTLDEVQALFAHRLRRLKKHATRYIELLKTESADLAEPCQKLATAIEGISVESDNNEFIQTYSTEPSHVPDDFVFEEYIKQGKPDEVKKTGWKAKLLGTGSKGDAATAPSYSPYTQVKASKSLDGLFGTPLPTLMKRQEQTHPDVDVPYFLYFIAEQIIKCGGEYTLGVFRLNGSTAKVEEIKQSCTKGDYGRLRFAPNQVNDLASVFKLFFRQLPDPLVPNTMYEQCFAAPPPDVNALVRQLPDVNRRVLLFLVALVQRFCAEETVERTKMNASNLAAIFAPCVFRCPYADMQAILRSSDAEKRFFERLIAELDTASATTVSCKCGRDPADSASPTDDLAPSGRAAIAPSATSLQSSMDATTNETVTLAPPQGTRKLPPLSGM